MKIGKHKGVRAKHGNDNGYFFETMKVFEFYSVSYHIQQKSNIVSHI